MATERWISYDPRDARQRRRQNPRRWPWFLLLFLLLLLLLAAVLTAAWLWYEVSDGVEPAQPVAIQAALPARLTDDAMIVYVVDDSGSMGGKLSALRQALNEVSEKPTENSEIALLMFGDTHQILFDFTEPDDAPWDDAIESFSAGSGATSMYLALQKALELLPDDPVCAEKTRFVFFSETICRQNRIVLISDGISNDIFQIRNITDTTTLSPQLEAELLEAQADFEATTIEVLMDSDVRVDTIALGVGADKGGLRLISSSTGGTFVRAGY